MAGFKESYRNIHISILDDLEKEADRFVTSPDRDFSRRRKLPFAETMKTVMYMEGNSPNKELCDIYNLQPILNLTGLLECRCLGTIKIP